jgi:MoxR-like ATPase
MEEGQVTLGGHPLDLPSPFMVLATQNPIEQHGTYPLSEAQLDRFLMMLKLGYPDLGEERRILRAAADGPPLALPPVATGADLLKARAEVESVMVQDALLEYVVEIVRASRNPASVGLADLEGLIEFGASPRAGIGLVSAARALAYLRERDYAVPDDVKDLAPDVLRHRLVLTYEAMARAVDVDEVIASILSAIPVPR